MKVKYVNLYNENGDLVMIKYRALSKQPKMQLAEKGVIDYLALEIKGDTIFTIKKKGQELQRSVNFKQMKNISGVEFQTADARHYFDLQNDKTVDIRTLGNSNLQIVIRGKRKPVQNEGEAV